jgi:hypothetical protein
MVRLPDFMTSESVNSCVSSFITPIFREYHVLLIICTLIFPMKLPSATSVSPMLSTSTQSSYRLFAAHTFSLIDNTRLTMGTIITGRSVLSQGAWVVWRVVALTLVCQISFFRRLRGITNLFCYFSAKKTPVFPIL